MDCLPQALSLPFFSQTLHSRKGSVWISWVLQGHFFNLKDLQLQKWFQRLTIYLKSVSILWILYLNGSMSGNCMNCEWSSPSRFKLA